MFLSKIHAEVSNASPAAENHADLSKHGVLRKPNSKKWRFRNRKSIGYPDKPVLRPH